MAIIDNLSRKKISKLQKSMSSPFTFKGSTTYAELPTSGNKVNDTYYCTDKKCKYSWNGSAWYQSSLNESEYENELSQLKKSTESQYEELKKADEDNFKTLEEKINNIPESSGSGATEEQIQQIDKNTRSIQELSDKVDGNYIELNKKISNIKSGATDSQAEQLAQNTDDINDLSDEVLSLTSEVKSATLTIDSDDISIPGADGIYFTRVNKGVMPASELIGAEIAINKNIDNENVEEIIVLDESNIVDEEGVIYVGSGLDATYPIIYMLVVSKDNIEIGDGIFSKGVWLANSDEYALNGNIYNVKSVTYGANLKDQFKAFTESISNMMANDTAGQFAVSDGKGGITWQTLAIAEEGAY